MAIGPGQGDTVEIEWQFDALDLRPAGRWLASLSAGSRTFPLLGVVGAVARPAVVQDDLYLDTEDWRIAQAGYVLRVRHAKEKQEITLKALPGVVAGTEPKRRREVTEPFTAPTTRWLAEAGPVGWRVSALIGRRPLHPMLDVRTRRRPFVLRIGDEDVAEVALDETAISIDDQNPMRLLRVEVEVEAAWAEALAPLVEDLRRLAGLSPAALSKFEAGILARGYAIPARVDLGPTSVGTDASIGALADAVLRRQLGALLTHEAGTRLGEDPEDLHDMRVATRRLRAAIGVFADVLPPQFGALAPELAWLASMLGSVRDLDVQLERLELAPEWRDAWASGPGEVSPLDELRALFIREREAARAALLSALDSPRYERLTTGLMALVQQRAGQRSTAGRLRATAVVPGLLEQRHRAAVKAAKRARHSGAATDFHRLRIRCKRLRYALEFVQDLYGESAVSFTRRLTRLQDLLGTIQDCQVAMERLHALATSSQPPLSRGLVFLMGTLAEKARADAAELLAGAHSKVNVLTGDEWQHLARTLERLRGETTPDGHVRPSGAAAATSTALRALPHSVGGPGAAIPTLGPGPEAILPGDDAPRNA